MLAGFWKNNKDMIGDVYLKGGHINCSCCDDTISVHGLLDDIRNIDAENC